MALNIPGIISMTVFYALTLAVGVWAGRKTSRSNSAEEVFLANRKMGLIVSLFTLTATVVGGAYINGTAEIVATSGILWAQAPVGYCIGMFLGGMIYAPKMRRAGYMTMFDPFQETYGMRVGALMCIPQYFGDIFWTAAVLSALGSTISIILEIDETLAIVISTVITVIYTFMGGLLSVAYTDIFQLLCIAIGLVVACPFSISHPAVDVSTLGDKWLGEIRTEDIGIYIDLLGVVMLGGIPWQVYYQRVLACRDASSARLSSCVAAVMCLLLAIPPAIMGVAGAATNWNATTYPGEVPLPPDKMRLILPLTLQYLSPKVIAIIGMGALSAAVMSSADSSILSSATVFTNNMYRNAIRIQASDREMVWVLRMSIVVVGVLSTLIALVVKSVYGLYVMCSDLMYVILFPQFTCVLFVPGTNPYGGLAGFLLSLTLRLFSGDPLIGLKPLIHFPFFSDSAGQRFPFRTLAMLLGFSAILLGSLAAHVVFRKGWLSTKWDVFGYFARPPHSKYLIPGMECLKNSQTSSIKLAQSCDIAYPSSERDRTDANKKDYFESRKWNVDWKVVPLPESETSLIAVKVNNVLT